MVERQMRARFNTQIYDEACEWFIECRADDLSEASRAEFDRWLRQSPEHLGAYLEIAAIWNEGPALEPSNKWDLQTLLSQAAEDSGNIVTLNSVPRYPAEEEHERRSWPRRWSTSVIAACVATAIVVVGAAIWLMLPRAPIYLTAIGEQRSLTLEDGSTIELNSLSKIQVRYSRHERTVDLLEGEVLCNVARDVARPFVVRSGATQARAVGTQFDVYKKPGGTVVTVVAGRVALQGITLAEGEQAVVTPQGLRKTEHPNVASATAWTQRQIVFDSASLAEVAEEFNRYNRRELVIDGAALGGLHISGVFSSTDSASLIRFLRQRPGLRISETPTEIHIEKTNP
jgi:transmembrane sensor